MVEERMVQWDEIGVKVEEVKEEMEVEVELMVVVMDLSLLQLTTASTLPGST